MTDLSETVQAGVAVAGALGGAIAWLWGRVEKMRKSVQTDLEACEDARHTQLIVIELFWRALEDLAPGSAVMERGRHLLDELKQRDEVRKVERGK